MADLDHLQKLASNTKIDTAQPTAEELSAIAQQFRNAGCEHLAAKFDQYSTDQKGKTK